MTIAEMIKELGEQPYAKDFRLQRHIIEDDACQDAKIDMAKRMGPHDAGHFLAVLDAVLMFVQDKGMPSDMDEVLSTYKLNGGKKRDKDKDERNAPLMTADEFKSLWGDDEEDD